MMQNVEEFDTHGWPDKAKLRSKEKQVAAYLTVQRGLIPKFSLDREQFDSVIARHGIPEGVLTDNGPQYSSQTSIMHLLMAE